MNLQDVIKHFLEHVTIVDVLADGAAPETSSQVKESGLNTYENVKYEKL